MKRKHPERALQSAVAEYLTWALPAGSFFSALPGGDGKMTRAPGYVSGLPDLMVVVDGRVYFIELKSQKGRASEAQKLVAPKILASGSYYRICRSINDVYEYLSFHGVQLKVRPSIKTAIAA